MEIGDAGTTRAKLLLQQDAVMAMAAEEAGDARKETYWCVGITQLIHGLTLYFSFIRVWVCRDRATGRHGVSGGGLSRDVSAFELRYTIAGVDMSTD